MPVAPAVVRARIFRFDPETDQGPRYDTIEIPYQPHMRVLDVLDQAVDSCGLGVGYRYFCGIKRCGMCGVSVNGKPVLACWEAASAEMTIEPLPKLPVIRDLAVDRTIFEGATVGLHPVLERHEPYEGFPEPLTHVEMHDAFKLMNCIECYVCSTSCPAVPDQGPHEFNGRDFVGPGTLVQIAKAALHPRDGRDRSGELELASLDNCMSCGRCEEVCPNSIPILSGAIAPLRARATKGPRGLARLPMEFSENVRANGNVNSAALFLRTRGWLRTLASAPMLIRMFFHRKTRLFPRFSAEARRSIDAVFSITSSGERK